ETEREQHLGRRRLDGDDALGRRIERHGRAAVGHLDRVGGRARGRGGGARAAGEREGQQKDGDETAHGDSGGQGRTTSESDSRAVPVQSGAGARNQSAIPGRALSLLWLGALV